MDSFVVILSFKRLSHPTPLKMATEAMAIKLEEEVKSLKEELDVYKEAKTMSEACASLSQFAQSTEEPFTSSHPEPNEWHKSAGGGEFLLLSCLA